MGKLTVLIVDSGSGAFWQIANGWRNALAAGGHTAIMWNGDWKTWHHYEPDIYIGCSGHRKEPLSDKTKTVIHVNPCCDDLIRSPGAAIINDSQAAVRWTLEQKPSLVFGYGLQEDIDRWWCHWPKKYGIPAIGMPNAADITIYQPTISTPEYECDIGWVGGYWPYKAQNLDKYLLPAARKYKTLWYGWSGPKDLWRGEIKQNDVIKLFNSAKVCPAVVEPHTTIYGIDIPERIFKVAACGALVLSDPFRGLERYFDSESITVANNPEEFQAMIAVHLSATAKERHEKAAKLRSQILSKHTYYHRVQDLLTALGYTSEANEYNAIIAALR